MNRSYRSIWNARTSTWVAAPESARAGRSSGRTALAGAALLLALGFMPSAHAQLSLTLGSGLALGLNGAIALSGLFNPAASASGSGAVAIGTNALSSGTNSIVLGINSTDSGLSNVLSIGSVGSTRQLINLSAGTIGAGSTDAVNGGQLYLTNQGQLSLGSATAAALGGGASYSLAAGVSVPTYAILGASQSGVGNAFAAVDTALGGLQSTVGAHTTALAGHTTQLASQATTLATHTTQIAANTTGLANANTAITANTSAITANTSAIAGNTTAIATANASLTTQGTAIAGNTAGLTAHAGLIGANTAGIASLGATVTAQAGQIASNTSAIVDAGVRLDANSASLSAHATLLSGLGASSANSVQYDGASKAQVTFGGASGTVLANVAAGNVQAGSQQAVNGGQLFQTNQAVAANTAQVASNTGAIASNTTNIANLTQQINAVGPGLVRQAGAGADLSVGALTDGLAVDFAGTAGARKLSGVAAGDVSASSTQAINGAQLHQTHQAVAANTAAVAAQGTALTALDGIALKYDSSLRNMVTLGGAGGTTIGNVASGTIAAGSLQAVNGGQLHQVQQQVAANTASIAALGSAQAINVGMQSNNVAGAVAPAATGDNATAVGFGASATAAGSLALGNGAASTGSNSVALGQGSTDDGAANVVSVGSVAQKRRVTNLADGVADSDAATAGQVRSVDERVGTLSARAVNYDLNPDQSVNQASVSFGAAGTPVLLRNVRAGSGSTDAANVGQLQSLASGIGGGMQLQVNGAFSQPSFSITQVAADRSTSLASFGSVADALSSLGQSIGVLAAGGGGGGGPMTVQNYTVNNTIVQMAEEYMYVHVNSANPDSSATGADSTAIGPMAQAQGDRAIAMGAASRALTASAVAIGDGAIAGGGRSVSIGQGNVAMGNGAVAIGDPNIVTGTGAVGMGADNTATGDGAVALGNLNSAIGNGAVAIGNTSSANGTGAIALGNNAQATVAGGVALGSGAVASRAGMNGATEAISNVAVASTQAAVSVGSAGNERQITNVAGGTQDTDAVNLRQLRAAQAGAVQEALAATDAKLNQVVQGVQRVERNASAGTAAAMAMAGMPQSAAAGKGMVSAGAGSYGGQAAIALGVSVMSETGRWISKLNASANSQGKVGLSVGAGFQW